MGAENAPITFLMDQRIDRFLNFATYPLNLIRRDDGKLARWYIGFKTLYRYYKNDFKIGSVFHIISFEGEYDKRLLDNGYNQYGFTLTKKEKGFRQYTMPPGMDVHEAHVNIYFAKKHGSGYAAYMPQCGKYALLPETEIDKIEWAGYQRTVNIPRSKGTLLESWWPMFYVPYIKLGDIQGLVDL